MRSRNNCPGCSCRSMSPPFSLPRQPVVLNYRFTDAEKAARIPRRNMKLQQCRRCGLVFNATFDVAAVPYDENYENRQSFSPAFQAHLDSLAKYLTRKNGLNGTNILEVGCGKGDFLRMLCAHANAQGVGYDTSYEQREEPKGLTFHKRYLTAADVTVHFDTVICRHVIEHVPEIGNFLIQLHEIAVAAGDPVVVLETPRFEWIVEKLSLWDVFYEHCNYFSAASLEYLCRLAGFRVLRHRSAFGSQYQILELRLARNLCAPKPPGIHPQAKLTSFSRRAQRQLDSLARKFELAANKKGWAVWGAGAKGVALVNHLRSCKPCCVVDSNPAKQGGMLPGSRIPIVSPDDNRLTYLGLIVISNPNYAREIRHALKLRGFAGRTLTL